MFHAGSNGGFVEAIKAKEIFQTIRRAREIGLFESRA